MTRKETIEHFLNKKVDESDLEGCFYFNIPTKYKMINITMDNIREYVDNLDNYEFGCPLMFLLRFDKTLENSIYLYYNEYMTYDNVYADIEGINATILAQLIGRDKMRTLIAELQNELENKYKVRNKTRSRLCKIKK